MAKGFLANQKKMCIYIGTGCMAFVLSGIPYTMFHDNSTWRYLGMAICIVTGIISIVLGMFAEQQEYNILKQEPLLFDYEFMKELTSEYNSKKKKYMIVGIPSTVLFIAGLLIFALTKRGVLLWSEYNSFVFLGLAIGILGFVYSLGIIETYELLIKNEQYSTSFFFKLKKKIKAKIDKILG